MQRVHQRGRQRAAETRGLGPWRSAVPSPGWRPECRAAAPHTQFGRSLQLWSILIVHSLHFSAQNRILSFNTSQTAPAFSQESSWSLSCLVFRGFLFFPPQLVNSSYLQSVAKQKQEKKGTKNIIRMFSRALILLNVLAHNSVIIIFPRIFRNLPSTTFNSE